MTPPAWRRDAGDAERRRPDVLEHFRSTLAPTEGYPNTVLHAEPGLRLSGDCRRYTAWRPLRPDPEVLRLADLDAVLASGTDFACKFDARVDAAVLDALDRHLGVRGGTGS